MDGDNTDTQHTFSTTGGTIQDTHFQPDDKSTKPCLFFLKGTCVFGDKCNLAHEEVNKHRIPVCKYFLRRNCTYGNQCLYRHEQQSTPHRRHHHAHQ